jgi:hypothetical protein
MVSVTVANNRFKAYSCRMPLRFTQAQVRKVLNLPPETMRHWRKVLPPLASRARRAPFSHGDIVALSAIRELVRSVGVNSSALAPCAASIFALCNDKPWHALAQCRLQIEGTAAQLIPLRSAPALKRHPLVMIPLSPLIEELSRDLSTRERAQPELKFPLATVRRVRR